MKKELNIGLLLDVCGVSYTEDQLIKLEKLIEDLLHDHRPNNVDISKIENHEKDDLLDTLEDEAKGFICESVEIKTIKLEEKLVKKCTKQYKSKNSLNVCETHTKSTSEQKQKFENIQNKHTTEKTLKIKSKKKNCKSKVPNLCQHCGNVFETPDQLRFI
jgi:hypothetical protein